jgi:hypothetical protein
MSALAARLNSTADSNSLAGTLVLTLLPHQLESFESCDLNELEENMSEQTPNQQEKGATEKFWEATRKTLHSATVQANRYKRLVQKKIDLASLHKKIGHAHSDLGRMVDDLREAGEANILENDKLAHLFQGLDGLKQAAAQLEEEIEAIKAETGGDEEEAKRPPADLS